MAAEFWARFPKAVFLLLPLFALLLRLLWRKRPYVEHLVFALHSHSVFFLCSGVALLPWLPFRYADLGSAVWILPALRRFCGSSWPASVLKAVVLAVMYLLLMVAAVVGRSWRRFWEPEPGCYGPASGGPMPR